MSLLQFEGQDAGSLRPSDYDMRRRWAVRRGVVCHAPFVGLAVDRRGGFAPCRHSALRLAEATIAAAWSGETLAAQRARFRDYRASAEDCASCVARWVDGRPEETPALADFDGFDLPEDSAAGPRVLAIVAGAEIGEKSQQTIRDWLSGLVRLEVTLSEEPLGFVHELLDLAKAHESLEVVVRLDADMGEDGLRDLARTQKNAGAAVEAFLSIHRDNWFEIGSVAATCTELDIALVLELLPHSDDRSLRGVRGDMLALVHGVVHASEQQAGASFAPVLGDLRSWQLAAYDPGDDVAFPPIGHSIVEEEEGLRNFLGQCLRIQADPALEHFLLGVVSMPDFVERARERASLCIAALWLASSFGRPEGIDALRTILGDDPTTVLSRHRDALAGTELLGPWLSGVEQQGLNAPPRRATWQVAPPQTAKGKRAADITVVVPSYRHERFIERTLASVLSQTATDLRVLVVDDQSDDRTVELAAATGDPRVEVVQNTSNLGLGGSLAGALDRIDTPFVAVLNSDDLYHHERLERCRQALVDRDLDLVATALAPVDAADHYCRVEDSPAALDGRRMHDWLRWYEDHCRFGEVPAQLFDELLQRCFLITSSNLFGRTDYLRQTKDRWEKLEFCVDWQLFLDSARHGRLGVLSDSLLAYRLHGSNTVWFDEDRDWRYWLEVNQVMARVLGDMVAEAGDGDFAPVLAALAGPISCNDHVGGSGILLGNLLNHLGLRPRDLEGADVVAHMRELCRKRRGTSRAQAMFDDFGGDVTLLHRLRAEWPEHAAQRSRSEALRDARGRIETLATGLVEERDNVERLWHSAEAERDQAEADKVEIHAEVAGEWERKKAELTDLYEKVGSLEGDVGRVEFEKSEVEREARETRERLEEGVRSADQRHSELTKRHGDLEHRHGDLEHRHGDLEHRHGDLEQRHGDLKQTHADLGHRHGELAAELERLRRSAEYRFGRRMLNKMRLRPVFNVLERWRNKLRHWFAIRRLTFDRLLSRKKPFRAMASICWNFPIYSQTFVYQELTQLWHRGFEVRHVYSLLGPRSDLHGPFEHLWGQKHWFPLDPARHFADYERFNKRMPDKVARLIEMLSEASGLREADLVAHNNFLEAFTYTRMVEAWRPHYLHSYFFYDRSLYALVAAFLLDLPRGVSCYADHLLDDYDLKVVALHVRLCDIVIATSARIKEELLALAPEIDADKIIVKPNAIDSDNFPVVDRPEPVDGPHRLACVCRIEPKKGLIYLADAMRILRDERKLAVELHVVGEADPSTPGSEACKRELDAYLEEHSLWGVVHLEGRKSQEEVRRFLDMSQIFVASFIETDAGDKDGIPTALLEAMSTGITPVVTDAGSMVEVVDADVDGLIVAQRSGVALADAIEVLIRGPERRAAFGRAAAAKARAKFDVRVCEGRFHERVDQLLATRREGA